MEETSDVTSPSKEVPYALFGEDLDTGMMRCGNWYSPLRLVGHEGGGGGGGGGLAHSGAQLLACRVISLGLPEAHWLELGGVA